MPKLWYVLMQNVPDKSLMDYLEMYSCLIIICFNWKSPNTQLVKNTQQSLLILTNYGYVAE